jgi:hypothetical protein
LLPYTKKIPALLVAVCFFMTVPAQQTRFSLATDVSLLRSFKKEQQFWAIGQTVHGHFHFTPKDGAYAWISYYSEGRVRNTVTATAKLPATTPQEIAYQNNGELRFKHISLGWKRYFAGTCNEEKLWNFYGYAGFGLMLGAVTNTHSVGIDTNTYDVPVLSGKANFKRLTFDLGTGIEKQLGGDVYLYIEARALVPASDYPSKYLFVNDNAPFTGSANLGIRILFQ